MKDILLVQHAKGISEVDIKSFISEVPEQQRAVREILKITVSNIPKGLIKATPKSMEQSEINFIKNIL